MKKITTTITTLLVAIALCEMVHAQQSVYRDPFADLVVYNNYDERIYMEDGFTPVSSLNGGYIATFWYSATGDIADLTPFGASVFRDLTYSITDSFFPSPLDPSRSAGILYWRSNENLPDLMLGESYLFAIRVFQAPELVAAYSDYYYENYFSPEFDYFKRNNGMLDITSEEIEALWNGVSSGETGDFQFTLKCIMSSWGVPDSEYHLMDNPHNFVGGNLRAVPEPSTWLLLGVAAVFLVLIRKTQKTRNGGRRGDGKGFVSLMFLCVFCIFLLSVSYTSYAAPFAQTFTFKQPDGAKIELWGVGDEYYAVFEHNDYTVMLDPTTKTYCYASLSKNGKELESTGLVVGVANPSKANLEKHLRISTESVREKVEARRRQLDPDGIQGQRWQQLKNEMSTREEAQRSRSSGEPLRAPPSSATIGSVIGLTILVDFEKEPATVPKGKIERFLNESGYDDDGNNGSVRDYFLDMSNGQLDYTNIVIGYIRAPHPKEYYDNNDQLTDGARLLIEDIVPLIPSLPNYATEIKPLLDTLTLTTSSSPSIVAVNIYYAGFCTSGSIWGLWPHAASVGGSGIFIGDYQMMSYQVTNIGTEPTLGIFCHENGHMLCGFPDLYDASRESTGVGDWCLMGWGNNLSGGKNPSQVNAYLKLAVGWATATDIDVTTTGIGTLTSSVGSSKYNQFYRVRKTDSDTEYYLLENRQKAGRDAHQAGGGIFIWRVDELGNNNNRSIAYNDNHENYELALVQADGLFHLEYQGSSYNYGDAQDPWYLGNTALAFTNQFNDTSTPSARWWDGTESGIDISNFSANADMMTFSWTATPLAVSTVYKNLPKAGGVFTVDVTATVSWAVSSSDLSWLTVSSTSGSGNETFTVTVAPYAGGERTGTITMTGGGATRTVAVVQKDVFELDKSWIAVPDTSGSFIVNVTANVPWTVSLDWTSNGDSSWVNVSPTSGSNNGSITISYAGNTGGARALRFMALGGNTVIPITVTQPKVTISSVMVDGDDVTLTGAGLIAVPPHSSVLGEVFSAESLTSTNWTVVDNTDWNIAPDGSFSVTFDKDGDHRFYRVAVNSNYFYASNTFPSEYLYSDNIGGYYTVKLPAEVSQWVVNQFDQTDQTIATLFGSLDYNSKVTVEVASGSFIPVTRQHFVEWGEDGETIEVPRGTEVQVTATGAIGSKVELVFSGTLSNDSGLTKQHPAAPIVAFAGSALPIEGTLADFGLPSVLNQMVSQINDGGTIIPTTYQALVGWGSGGEPVIRIGEAFRLRYPRAFEWTQNLVIEPNSLELDIQNTFEYQSTASSSRSNGSGRQSNLPNQPTNNKKNTKERMLFERVNGFDKFEFFESFD